MFPHSEATLFVKSSRAEKFDNLSYMPLGVSKDGLNSSFNIPVSIACVLMIHPLAQLPRYFLLKIMEVLFALDKRCSKQPLGALCLLATYLNALGCFYDFQIVCDCVSQVYFCGKQRMIQLHLANGTEDICAAFSES